MFGRRVSAEILHACLRIQRPSIQWIAGARTGGLVAATILVGLAIGRLEPALSISIGLLFAAIVDSADSRRVRRRSMLWGTLWIGVAVLVGGLVSDMPAVHAITAIVMALACGYAGALGPRGGLIGVLTLVLFAFYAGAAVVADIAVLDAGYVVLGCLITTAVNLLVTPPRQLGTVRSAIAHAYRELEDAATRRGTELAAPAVAAAIMSARTVIDHEGCDGASLAWANRLLADAERARLALLALISERSIDPAYVDDLTDRLARTARGIADVVGAPLAPVRGRIMPRLQVSLGALREAADRAPDPRLAILARDVAGAVTSATTALEQPWPIGPRACLAPPSDQHVPIMPRLRAHWSWSDPVAEHAMRLAIAFGGATVATVLVDVSHAYWLPLTVAWIAKPDLANTVTRVSMRIAGTVAGLVITSVVFALVTGLPGEAAIFGIAAGVTGALAIAYLNANYPIAVIGITAFVLLIERLFGDPEQYDVIARLLATVLAGAWVLLVASIRPRRTGSTAISALKTTTDALREYATAVRAGQDTAAVRARVLSGRTAALAAVSAATLETPGLWERHTDRVDPVQAAAVMTDVIDAASAILAEELLEREGLSDTALWSTIDQTLDDIDARVAALPPGS